MKKISREEFIKTSSFALAAALSPMSIYKVNHNPNPGVDESMINRLVKGNEKSVENYLKRENEPQRFQYYRNLSGPFASLSAAYCHPKSSYYKSKEVLDSLENTIDKLLKLQYPNGTLDAGGNRQSPPDTAFLLNSLCPAAKILKSNNYQELSNVKNQLDKFLLKAGEGIRTGGVHTPNHRWEESSILAQLYSIYKDDKYLKRIDQWLEEGIYMNEDGNYPERSRNYSIVENEAYIHLGEILNQSKFFDIVKRSLTTNYYYMELNGELVCLDSRRQDQYKPISALNTYLLYRFMAIHENDGFLSAIAREIEALEGFEQRVLSYALPLFMTSSVLIKELPKISQLPENYTKHFVGSDLVRIKRGDSTASIFGGNDKPIIISSGRSCIPTFFTFRKRYAILEYARLSTNFFNIGYVRPDGVIKEGNKYILKEKKEAYYYHPMPKNKLNKNGDYALTESVDRRFWSKMDFGDRPRTTLTQDSQIIIEENDNTFKIDLDINGPENVEVTLELCFNEKGKLEGVTRDHEDDDFFLESGFAKYSLGNDIIEVGPGKMEHTNIRFIDGEEYSTHFGTLKSKGKHLYITGLVPFKHSITIK